MFFRQRSKAKRQAESIDVRIIRTYGLNEQDVRKKLKSLGQTFRNVEFLSHPKGVDITLTVKAESHGIAKEMADAVESHINKLLGEYVYGTGCDKLEHVVGKALVSCEKSLSVAESCTGGLICHWLTNVPGSSRYFKQGVITYSNSAKMDLLNLQEETLKKSGAVSRETAEAMAEGARETGKTDIGLAVSGIAGPGKIEDKPAGLVFISVAGRDGITSEKYRFGGGRELIKIQAAQAALDLLRRSLCKKDAG